MKIISPQLFLVDRIPCHVKDLCTRPSLTKSEEDFDNTSESGAESLLLEEENTESDNLPEDGAEAEPLSLSLRRRTCCKWPLPGCHLCDHEIGGEVLWEKWLTADSKVNMNMSHIQSAVKKEKRPFLEARFVGCLSWHGNR